MTLRAWRSSRRNCAERTTSSATHASEPAPHAAAADQVTIRITRAEREPGGGVRLEFAPRAPGVVRLRPPGHLLAPVCGRFGRDVERLGRRPAVSLLRQRDLVRARDEVEDRIRVASARDADNAGQIGSGVSSAEGNLIEAGAPGDCVGPGTARDRVIADAGEDLVMTPMIRAINGMSSPITPSGYPFPSIRSW